MAEEPTAGLRSRSPAHPVATYAVTVLACLVIVALGAYIGYVVSGHQPIGVFAGAAIALVALGVVGTAVNLLVKRRAGPPEVGPPTDAVLGQGKRTGFRDPDAS
jgi:uncharacterized membrane protein